MKRCRRCPLGAAEKVQSATTSSPGSANPPHMSPDLRSREKDHFCTCRFARRIVETADQTHKTIRFCGKRRSDEALQAATIGSCRKSAIRDVELARLGKSAAPVAGFAESWKCLAPLPHTLFALYCDKGIRPRVTPVSQRKDHP